MPRSQGPMTTVLLLVPLISLPMLAIFGIPQFAPLSISSPVDESVPVDESNPPEPELQLGHSHAHAADDLFAPFAESNGAPAGAELTAEAAPAPWVDPFEGGHSPNADGAAGVRANEPTDRSSAAAPQTAYVRTVAGEPRGASAAADEASSPAEPLTWATAVRRLNELNISNFRLEPGASRGEFSFVCWYTPADNPRITHRFEAEADEPLRAVEKVLRQIDKWRARR